MSLKIAVLVCLVAMASAQYWGAATTSRYGYYKYQTEKYKTYNSYDKKKVDDCTMSLSLCEQTRKRDVEKYGKSHCDADRDFEHCIRRVDPGKCDTTGRFYQTQLINQYKGRQSIYGCYSESPDAGVAVTFTVSALVAGTTLALISSRRS